MTQPLGNCPGCGADESFEQVHEGVCPDLVGECPEWACAVCGAGVIMGNVFTGSVITGSVLTGSVFTGSVFTGSVFTGSVFTGAAGAVGDAGIAAEQSVRAA
jgi:hypothetical protein